MNLTSKISDFYFEFERLCYMIYLYEGIVIPDQLLRIF